MVFKVGNIGMVLVVSILIGIQSSTSSPIESEKLVIIRKFLTHFSNIIFCISAGGVK